MATNPNTQAGLKKFEDTTIAFENMIVQVGRAIGKAQREMDVTQIEFQKEVARALKEGKISRLDVRPMNAYVMPETSLDLKIGMTMTYPEGSSEPTLSAVPLNAATTNQNDVSVEAATEINLKFVTVPDSKAPKEPQPSALTEADVQAIVDAHWMSDFANKHIPGLNTVRAYLPEERIWISMGLSATEPAYGVLINDRTGAIIDVILKPLPPSSAETEPVGVPLYTAVSPAQAKVGEIVTITGDNFATLGGQTLLQVDGRPVPIVRLDMTTIAFKFPGWVGAGDIEVITPIGTTGVMSGVITPLPTLGYAEPLKGYYDSVSRTGSWVAVYGYNFNVDIDFKFANGSSPKSLKLVSSNKIEVEVGPNAVSGPVYLENKLVPGYQSYSTDLFIMIPRVDRVSPRQGVVGEEITLIGNSLSEVTSLIMGDTPVLAADFTLHTDDEIRFLLPARAFDGKIGLFVGTSAATSTEPTVWTRDIFYVVPKITGFSSNIANRNEIITVYGEGLDPDPTMMTLLFEGYGGISEAPVLSVSDDRTSLTTRVPIDAVTGYVMLIRKKIFSGSNAADTSNTTDNKVTVLTTDGLVSDLVLEERFDTDLANWTIDSGGWTIDAGRLACDATLGKLSFAYPAALSQMTLYADVLSGESFGFFIDVDSTSVAGYEVMVDLVSANPTITWREVPVNGQSTVLQQTALTLTSGANYLMKLSLVADTFTLSLNQSLSDSLIVTLTPLSVLGFSVLSNSAIQRWDNVIAMKGDYLALPKPGFYRFGEIPEPPLYPEIIIDSFTPQKGDIGTEITLTGSGLDTNARFYFGSVEAAVVEALGTSARITVPVGAKSGTIKVIGRGGVIAATKSPFVLPPVISGFIPTTVQPGDRVTIIGENLPVDPTLAQVQILGTLSDILGATSSALTVLVPNVAATGSGPVTILYAGFTSTSTASLTVVQENVFYSLRTSADQAIWSNALGQISYGGIDASGALVMTRNPQKMEDQFSYESVLVLNPPPLNLRALRGVYPVMDFPAGALELRLAFGAALSDSSITNELLETQSVKYEVSFIEEISGVEMILLPRTLCTYDQTLENFVVDLSSVAGSRGQIVLSVFSGDTGGFESGVVQAEIVNVV